MCLLEPGRSVGGAVETVVEFVGRTQGPAVPFVPDWYPWVYAHHYLRLETAQLPAELSRGRTSLTATEAREVIQLWCALTGEGIEDAARVLADAYLRRWGLARSDGQPAAPAGTRAAGTRAAGTRAAVAGRARRVRQLRRRAARRTRTGAVAALVPVGRRASTGS
jgi:hypothetical protein